MNTLEKLNLKYTTPKEPKINAPEEGWKQQAYYKVMVSFRFGNPFYDYILFTGFINDDGDPSSYNFIVSGGLEMPKKFQDVYALEVIGELITKEESLIPQQTALR